MAWTEEEIKHGYQGENNARVEAAHWVQMRATGLLEDGDGRQGLADQALQDVMPSKGKAPQALKNAGDDEEGDQASESGEGKDGQVAEAEVLSAVGKALPKKEAVLRVSRMVKLLKQVKKDVGAAKGKPLDGRLEKLQKLEKQGAKLSMEDAKVKLFDAALQIKKVKMT